MKRCPLVSLVLLFTLMVSLIAGGCAATSSTKIKIVTGTSLLYYVTQQVGGNNVEIVNLIPPSQHPGNFNVRPGDVETLAKATLFLLHGWPGEGYADKFIASANNPNLTVVKAGVSGNAMIPSFQAELTDKVAEALSKADSKNASSYSKAAGQYKQRITDKEKEIVSKLQAAGIGKVNVISASMQADFIKWAGFNVIATYSGPNALTPQTVKDLVDKGKQSGVTLIIDNLQNGKDAGKGIAEEIGAKQVNLSNFPGGFDNTATWEQAIDKNVDLLVKAIGK